jgi:RNA polymerase sigma factor (sigma-70 family)
MTRARDGDGEAFGELVEPYRRELQVHCYRILGSVPDAEDALQETLLAAWRGLGGFQGRASIRTWLYRAATNHCLKALRTASRRPAMSRPDLMPPEPTRVGEAPWLEPYPDDLLEGLADDMPGPEARYEAREAISLAFLTALQLLPPRQRAVLVLRDVAGFRAAEVAQMLDATGDSVTSALKRARATLARQLAPSAGHQAPPPPGSALEHPGQWPARIRPVPPRPPRRDRARERAARADPGRPRNQRDHPLRSRPAVTVRPAPNPARLDQATPHARDSPVPASAGVCTIDGQREPKKNQRKGFQP